MRFVMSTLKVLIKSKDFAWKYNYSSILQPADYWPATQATQHSERKTKSSLFHSLSVSFQPPSVPKVLALTFNLV